MTARVLASTWKKSLIGVHHTLGHLSSPWLVPQDGEDDEPRFPILTLSASGGHTDLWYRTGHLTGELLAQTRDDAAGEAFDKGASLLGLPYPGGPSIAAKAEGGDRTAYEFPSPLAGDATLDFSYSGMKTALKYLLRDRPEARTDLKNLCASYEHAICLELLDRTKRALKRRKDAKEIHLVGGVSANLHLRSLMAKLCEEHGIRLRHPRTLAFCTDNAAMIAAAGFFLLQEDPRAGQEPFLTAASLPLPETLRQ